MIRCASGRGRTCRGGGRPGGSTHSLSAPAIGESYSSGGKREKGSHLLGVFVLCYVLFSLQNPPALQRSDKLHQKHAKLKFSKHIIILTTTQFIYFPSPHYMEDKQGAKKQPWMLPSPCPCSCKAQCHSLGFGGPPAPGAVPRSGSSPHGSCVPGTQSCRCPRPHRGQWDACRHCTLQRIS